LRKYSVVPSVNR